MTKPPPSRAQLDAIAPPYIRAEAAVWVTELHSPIRDAQLEANVRRWIAEDPRHAAAFELATDAWQRSGNRPAQLPQRDAYPNKPHLPARATRPPAHKRALIAGITVLCAALAVATYLLTDDTLSTGPNEQKTVALPDGSQVTVNANSHLVVQFDDHRRKVTLTRGEALFNVAKHLPRPFVVVIGERKVIALGTAFEVRRDDSVGADATFSVTLMEGKVAIEPLSAPDLVPAAAPRAPTDAASHRASVAPPTTSENAASTPSTTSLTLLNPGDRLRFTANTAGTIDHPNLDKVTAWQRGQLIFDDVSLAEAVEEFNRYGSLKITITSASAANLRVGGVFRISDPTTFAEVMATTHHLQLKAHHNEILLTD